MTALSDNVQSAITAVLQSASIQLDYVGDLHHGYHDNPKQQLRSVITETTDPHVVRNSLNTTEKQKQQNDTLVITCTAIGLPQSSAMATAMERMNEDTNKVQDADDDPALAATAIEIPDLEPITNVSKEGGDDYNEGYHVDDDAALLSNTQIAITTVASSPAAEARNVVDNLASYDPQKAPSPTPSPMKHEQNQPDKSLKQMARSENVKLSVDSNQNVQNATAGLANDDALVVDSHVHSNSLDASGAVTSMMEPTLTIIDSVKSADPTPVEPKMEAENIQEPQPDSATAAATCAVQTMYSTCPTPADTKTTHSPNMEEHTFADLPLSEKVVPAGQVVVTKDLAADEIKIERAPPSESTTPTPPEIKQIASVVVADIKTEELPQVEEHVTTDDIKIESITVEQAQHGTINAAEQQSTAIDATGKEDDEYIATKGNDTKNIIGKMVPTTTADDTKPHGMPDSATPDMYVTESDKLQQSTMPTDGQSRSMNSDSSPPQTHSQHNEDPTDQLQEQLTLESDSPKSSKCIVM
ncbi:hypothetical protein BCR42DRAFT_406960 [Absidia repens]|uniref:Uncharacterized protein n=1 Tax=Absidia repens TaxID=90262 RepID=A0A1X2IRN9_9FUNG|nr:hypothetical protein BCR42DRAFT_406960 [Absidia repens]